MEHQTAIAMDPPGYRAPPGKMRLLLLAAALGVAVMVGERLIFSAALGLPLLTTLVEIDAIVMGSVLTAIPFIFLAFMKPRLLPWLVAIAATIGVHGWWLAQGIAYQMSGEGGGVPMVGMMVLLLSPFVILIAVAIVNAVMASREGQQP